MARGLEQLWGALGDVYRYGIDEEFIREVSEKLTPGKWAVVSQISEKRVTPVDSRMETIDGTVFRTDWQNIKDKRFARDVVALREYCTVESEMEALYEGLPFAKYGKDEHRLR